MNEAQYFESCLLSEIDNFECNCLIRTKPISKMLGSYLEISEFDSLILFLKTRNAIDEYFKITFIDLRSQNPCDLSYEINPQLNSKERMHLFNKKCLENEISGWNTLHSSSIDDSELLEYGKLESCEVVHLIWIESIKC